jgi:hypothetical protein
MRRLTIAVAVCVLSALTVGCVSYLPEPSGVDRFANYFVSGSDIKSLEYSYSSFLGGVYGKYEVRVERK